MKKHSQIIMFLLSTACTLMSGNAVADVDEVDGSSNITNNSNNINISNDINNDISNKIKDASSIVPKAATNPPSIVHDIVQNITQGVGEPAVFGEQLFQGNFAATYGSTFTSDYLIKSGDIIQVRMLGAYEYAAAVTVDENGYIELPNVMPLKLAGIKNEQLNRVVADAVNKAYRSKVGVYAALESAQPVKVFVTGFVNAPGYYSGLSSDSVLAYLDRAKGIDNQRGSYIDIQIKRRGKLIQQVNLYDFLLSGQLQPFRFEEGDVVNVAATKNTFTISGAVRNDYTFEYGVLDLTVGDAISIANPKIDDFNVSIIRQSNNPPLNTQSNNRIPKAYPFLEIQNELVKNGDYIVISATQ